MSVVVTEQTFSLAEFHRVDAGGAKFLYLVPSGAIFQLDTLSDAVIRRVETGPVSRPELVRGLVAQGFLGPEVEAAVEELHRAHAIQDERGFFDPATLPEQSPAAFPLQTLVINLTNQCNLSCQYCYEFGEDKVATPDGKPKFMEWETARESVDYLYRESSGRRAVHITFFGGETLMNFPLLKRVVDYAREQAQANGVSVDFSLTTNGTLLTPEIVRYLSDNEIGVTVSMDGPKEMQDALRVYASGKGSYDVIEPRVRELLKSHTTRPIAARVTLTSQVRDVKKIFKHLKHDLGFHEVGFAPVTTSPNRLYAIQPQGMDDVLAQFRELAAEYLDCALRDELHGFSNVNDTLNELHAGISKSHPCGAGLGLLGVGPSGDLAPCHRFVDSDTHKLGHISTGIDREKQNDFLKRGHIHAKYDCHSCWARPVCAGGCHHEAFVRYGDTGHPNLHYCDWIRGWTDLCLHIYGEIAVKNPKFLGHFERRKTV